MKNNKENSNKEEPRTTNKEVTKIKYDVITPDNPLPQPKDIDEIEY